MSIKVNTKEIGTITTINGATGRVTHVKPIVGESAGWLGVQMGITRGVATYPSMESGNQPVRGQKGRRSMQNL